MSDKKKLSEIVKAKLEDIKKLLFASDPIQTTTADGVSFFTDGDLAVGAKPYTKDDAGNVQPLPVAQYTLQDGSIMDVQVDPADTSGTATVVAAIEAPGADDNEMKEVAEMVSEALKTEMAKIPGMVEVAMKAHLDTITQLNASITSLSETNKTLTEKYEAEKAANIAFKKELVEVVEKIADSPADEAEGQNKNTKFSNNKKSEKEMLKDLVDNYVSNIKTS